MDLLASVLREITERTQQLQIVRRVKEVTLFNHQYSKDWEKSFIKAADELCQEKELIELGRQLSALQLIALIRSYFINQREGWKLLFIIGSLDSSTLIEMLTTLDTSQLGILNICLKRGMRQHPDWFTEAIKRQAETFLSRCSEMEEGVNALAERFASDDKCHQLRSSDLQLIRQIRETARLRYDCLSEKLSRVYKEIIADDRVCAQLTEELPSRYRLLLKRLTDVEAPEGNPQNCLLPIINKKVFDSSEFTPDDKAFEMLGEWSIISLPDYFKTGLFGNISKEEFDRMTATKKNSDLYQLAIDNLSFLGIELISDWKRLEIFNGRILKDYLKEEGRSQILRKRSFSSTAST